MRYIKFFEGFESDALSAVLSYISKKVGKNEYSKFLQQLKTLEHYYDIPLGSVTNDQIQYLPSYKALTVGNGEEVMNPTEIYCIKYWFSLKDGYIGETGTGNKQMDFTTVSRTMFPKATGGVLSQDILDSAKHMLEDIDDLYDEDDDVAPFKRFGDVSGGLLTPVKTMADIKTGDIIIGVYDPDEEESESYILQYWQDYLVVGKVFVTDDNTAYVFNNTFNYDYPNVPRERYEDLADSFLGCMMMESTDYGIHYNNIFKLTPDDGPLRFTEKMKEEEEDYSMWNFNLPVRSGQRKYLVNWDSGYKQQLKDVQSADFAIVLYLDDILVNDSKTDIVNTRKSEKENASALLSNNVHKKINLNKYIDKMFTQHGFESESNDFKKLNSIVAGISKNMLISDSLSRLSNFTNSIHNLIMSNDKPYSIQFVKDEFKSLKNTQFNIQNISNNISYAKKSSNKYIYNAIKKIMDIGSVIQQYSKDNEIKTIYDLTAVSHKLNSIKQLHTSNVYKLSDALRSIQQRINSDEYDMKTYVDNLEKYYDEKDYKEDMIKLDNLEKYVRSILK